MQAKKRREHMPLLTDNYIFEICHLADGKCTRTYRYLLQNDKEDEHYNAETEISLKDFPHIKMTLGEIFEGMEASA